MVPSKAHMRLPISDQ